MSYPVPALLAMRPLPMITGLLAGLLLVAGPVPTEAHAGVEDWELSEVHPQSGGDPQLRFIELVNEVGGCLFPTSTLHLYDAGGGLIDIIPLATITTCHGAPTFLLLATPEAASSFSVDKDLNLPAELPSSGQLCFVSSSTLYDCVRWGTVTTPVVDLFGNSDTTSLAAPADGFSLARQQTTHVVADDWTMATATPRAPNDGTVWDPPDAGPPADAGTIVDAGPPADAARRSDAGPPPDARPDAQNTRYLDLDAVGGADCGCRSSGGQGAGSFALVLLALLAMRRRSS